MNSARLVKLTLHTVRVRAISIFTGVNILLGLGFFCPIHRMYNLCTFLTHVILELKACYDLYDDFSENNDFSSQLIAVASEIQVSRPFLNLNIYSLMNVKNIYANIIPKKRFEF